MTASHLDWALRRPTRRMSDTIAVARVICITGMVYAHAWTGLNYAHLVEAAHTAQGVLRWQLMEFLGRSAVPLLSIVAGWLAASSALNQNWGSFAANKARTVLTPMLLWNGLSIAIVGGLAFGGLLAAPAPREWLWTIEELFAFTQPNDINVQMPFLRDLFVCMLFVPFLVRLPSWALLGVLGVALTWSITEFQFVLLLRPSILVFLLIGILARRGDLAEKVAAKPIALLAMLFVATACLKAWVMYGAGPLPRPAHASADLVLRLGAAAFFWRLAWAISESKFAERVKALEPYMFLLFCSHMIMIWLFGPLIGLVTGPLGSPLYPVFLIAQPFLVLGGTILLGNALAQVAPNAAQVLSGGRMGAAQTSKAAARQGA
ncbi:MAG: acyltransferase family protein [Hyphomonadaceae bacterium JAD_PAG50586_4]|nr:MAG: acyltransferase family protein [Hyphomonadaceae bacterium JAD_PAG50586_4]